MTALAPNLFDPTPAPDGHVGFALRDYQGEDVDATMAAWASGRRAVMCREATGLGKSIFIAETARRISVKGRVLVVVDVTNLAADLIRSITFHTGQPVGILTGDEKEGWSIRRIVVATAQTLYAGGVGHERFKDLDPFDFSAVLIDEAETSIAERYSSIPKYFLGNPQLVLAGCTATPFRGDGRGMGEIFDCAADQPGPLNRDILWGRDNGWLVHIRQGFVRVSLDFSTLKLKKDDEGVKDYTDSDLVKMFEDESPLVELAKGIHKCASGQPSIVICPNSVEFAKKLSHYLDAEQRGCANAIYGEQGKRADDLIEGHKRGDYPYAVSVNKLYKGYDFCGARYVFMCRKTRSRRLYEQALGRGSRPLTSIRSALNAATSPEERRGVIAASEKPFMVMVDMVGVHPCAKDLGVIDILGQRMPERVRERAKTRMMESEAGEHDTESEGETAARQLDEEAKAEAARKEAEAAKERERIERRRRRMLRIDADVSVEITDDLRIGSGETNSPRMSDQASFKQINLMIALGYPRQKAERCGRRQAGAIISSYTARGVKPDWSRLRDIERAPSLSLQTVPPSDWQCNRLHKLGHVGRLPPNYDSASRLIRDLESSRKVGAA